MLLYIIYSTLVYRKRITLLLNHSSNFTYTIQHYENDTNNLRVVDAARNM